MTTAPTRASELDCEMVESAEFDYDAATAAPEGADADPAVAVARFAESEGLSPGAEDVRVSEYWWHRIDDDGRLLYKFRLEAHPDGSWYMSGYDRCFPLE
ncbi:hypothetical protein [Ornithinimicrobium cryptoxanthini]|uniref:hypothetical protein n=1 Tax=Ornithinimicrobium cryptoxanthini TaxID=2934161 RepID=UPI002118EF0E|nr:hypothetical protein [Ornithinimicrobium cryptoxanthini]